MRQATKKALLASIEHWKQNEQAASLADATIGPQDCALCQRFDNGYCERQTETTTERCPVYAKTGEDCCEQTPYYEAYAAYDDGNLPAFRRAAKAEREFLESLLPSDPQT